LASSRLNRSHSSMWTTCSAGNPQRCKLQLNTDTCRAPATVRPVGSLKATLVRSSSSPPLLQVDEPEQTKTLRYTTVRRGAVGLVGRTSMTGGAAESRVEKEPARRAITPPRYTCCEVGFRATANSRVGSIVVPWTYIANGALATRSPVESAAQGKPVAAHKAPTAPVVVCAATATGNALGEYRPQISTRPAAVTASWPFPPITIVTPSSGSGATQPAPVGTGLLQALGRGGCTPGVNVTPGRRLPAITVPAVTPHTPREGGINVGEKLR